MPHDEHGPEIMRLRDLISREQGRVEPARAGDAGSFHELFVDEPGEHPFVIDFPDAAPMLPRIFGKSVV
jgi:hypothetical protein